MIGIEREIHDKPAGLRTNILICMGSTLFMSVSTQIAALTNSDPTRIAAQIISGIGFLGAGAVLHSHGFVVGLTTAATIWVVAGIGMALGGGMYTVAVFATAMSLATLYFMSFVESKIQYRRSYNYLLVVTDLHQALTSINKVLHESSASATSFTFKKKTSHYHVGFDLLASRETNLKIIQQLSAIPEITEIETSSARDFPTISTHHDAGDKGGPL
jgi:putative Mg2+ transporter-C (MgtC) family protein